MNNKTIVISCLTFMLTPLSYGAELAVSTPFCRTSAQAEEMLNAVRSKDRNHVLALAGIDMCRVLPKGTEVFVIDSPSIFTKIRVVLDGESLTGYLPMDNVIAEN